MFGALLIRDLGYRVPVETHFGHHLLNRSAFHITHDRNARVHTHTQRARRTHTRPQTTQKHANTKERQDKGKTADLRDDPGLCGLLCAPHCEIPVFPVLKESSNAVVAVHVSANVPKDHIEDEEYGEDEERY